MGNSPVLLPEDPVNNVLLGRTSTFLAGFLGADFPGVSPVILMNRLFVLEWKEKTKHSNNNVSQATVHFEKMVGIMNRVKILNNS